MFREPEKEVMQSKNKPGRHIRCVLLRMRKYVWLNRHFLFANNQRIHAQAWVNLFLFFVNTTS